MVSILLDNARDEGGVSYLYEEPFEIVRADEMGEVAAALLRLEAAVKNGAYAAGYFSYELSYCLEEKLRPLLPRARAVPLLWFGLFHKAHKLQRGCVRAWIDNNCKGGFEISEITPSWEEVAYTQHFVRVQEYIHAGDIYQANLTFKAQMRVDGDVLGLYARLRALQPVSYGAYIDTGDLKLLSLSPECFVRKEGNRIESKPLKGTAPRGRWAGEDRAQACGLQSDTKSQAENLMIVDLMRNDIGRIAAIGSMDVPALFETETYRTLHQMTSTVQGRMREGVDLSDFVRALFPPGSVTGAPKIRAQEVIAECETTPRGVYTGAIGMFIPDGAGGFNASFNVAIRTLMVRANGQAEMGIGSGVVADSVAADEYRECLLKMKFLIGKIEPVQLVETMLWEEGKGFAYAAGHKARMQASACYYGIPFDNAAYAQALSHWEAQPKEGQRQRVRLLLSMDGAFAISSSEIKDSTLEWKNTSPLPLREGQGVGSVEAMNPSPRKTKDLLTQAQVFLSSPSRGEDKCEKANSAKVACWRYVISDKRVNSGEAWLYHKTTQRGFLDSEREAVQQMHGAGEVLFLNERGELTQGSYTNIFLEMPDGRLLTPTLSCGLLPGVLRAALLAEGKAEETVLMPADLEQAKAVYLGNSVRGLVPALPVAVSNIKAA